MFKEFILTSGVKLKINLNNITSARLVEGETATYLVIWYSDGLKDEFYGADAPKIYNEI